MQEMHEELKRKESIPSDLKQGEFENHVGWRFWERRECLEGEYMQIDRERSRKWGSDRAETNL